MAEQAFADWAAQLRTRALAASHSVIRQDSPSYLDVLGEKTLCRACFGASKAEVLLYSEASHLTDCLPPNRCSRHPYRMSKKNDFDDDQNNFRELHSVERRRTPSGLEPCCRYFRSSFFPVPHPWAPIAPASGEGSIASGFFPTPHPWALMLLDAVFEFSIFVDWIAFREVWINLVDFIDLMLRFSSKFRLARSC